MGLIPSLRKGRKPSGPGQALVEFALTFLAFLILLFLIIEVGRIMFAWIIIQRAANEGARYAVTGQFMSRYEDPAFDWTANTTDPLDHILPCWALFPDDEYVTTISNWQVPAYQPYRNARTCSVERKVLESMVVLPLNPQALDSGANYYNIEVMSPARVETTSVFTRYWEDPVPVGYPSQLNRSTYAGATRTGANYTGLVPHYLQNGGLNFVPGYAGDPQQTVVVRVIYRLPIITPVLSNIVPSIRLVGAAQLTNEAFGATGIQREAILPPPLPPLQTPGAPLPPDLRIIALDYLGGGGGALNRPAGTDVTLEYSVKNLTESPTTANAQLQVYMVRKALADTWTPTELALLSTGAMPWPSSPDAYEMTFVSGTSTIASLAGGDVFDGDITVTIPSAAVQDDYVIYMRVDSSDAITEEGTAGTVGYDLTREELNITAVTGALTIAQAANLVTTLTVNPAIPLEGQTVTYTVQVQNGGPDVALNSGVRLTRPTGYTFVPGTLPAGCTITEPDVVCTLGDLNPSDTVSRDIQMTVDSGQSGNTLTVPALAFSDTDELDSSDNSDSVDVVVNAVDLAITKVSDVIPPVLVNQAVRFTLTVTNNGSIPATNIVVRDTLLINNFNYVSIVGSGATYDAGTRTVTWNIASLAPSATASIDINTTAAASGSIGNTARIDSQDQFDVDTTDNQVTLLMVANQSDLQLTKSVNPASASVGTAVTYTMILENLSGSFPAAATGVTISDVLPAQITYDTGVCSPSISGGFTGTYNSGTDVWTLNGSIPIATPITLTICGRVATGTAIGTIINNNAVASSTTFDPTTTNNGASSLAPVTVVSSAALSLTQSPGSLSFFASQSGNLTFTVTNTGSDAASNVQVVLSNTGLPSNLSYTLSGSAPSGTTYDAGTRTWTLPTLAGGASQNITVTVRGINGNFSANQVYSSTATASASGGVVSVNANAVNVTVEPFIIASRFGTTDNACDATDVTWGGGTGADYHSLVNFDAIWPRADSTAVEFALSSASQDLQVAFPSITVTRVGTGTDYQSSGTFSFWTGGFDDAAATGGTGSGATFTAYATADSNLARCSTISNNSGTLAGGSFSNLPAGTYRIWVLSTERNSTSVTESSRQFNFVWRNGNSGGWTNFLSINPFHFGDLADGANDNLCRGSGTFTNCGRVLVVVRDNSVVVTGGATVLQVGAQYSSGSSAPVNAVMLQWVSP